MASHANHFQVPCSSKRLFRDGWLHSRRCNRSYKGLMARRRLNSKQIRAARSYMSHFGDKKYVPEDTARIDH